MKKKQIEDIFDILAKENPNPTTELSFVNQYTLLTAIMLSAQATDKSVNLATGPLFAFVNNPADMLKLGEEGLCGYIKTIGLWRTKAANIIATARIILDKFQGNVPNVFEELNALPGVGTKTANVFLNVACGVPVIAVDTHVYRVSNRIGLVNEKSIDKTAVMLNRVVPPSYKQHAHHWLILHGRYVCKARNPNCDGCKIGMFCKFKCKAVSASG